MDVLQIIGWTLFYVLNIVLAIFFVLPLILMLGYYLSGKKNVSTAQLNKKINNQLHSFAAILTAHQDIRFIAPAVDSFLKQEYQNFILYVVADDCEVSSLHFTDERIVLLKPPTALHSKIKSISYAMDNFKSEPDVLVIFDSDNLVHPSYLKNLNQYFQQGFEICQTHMLSKNIDDRYARLDSMGHIYYTFYERLCKMKLGLSSAILGLGVAVNTKLYREMNYQTTIGGFDKKLQAQMASRVKQIAFAEDALVYDEKVEDASVMETQRTRWIFTYFKYFKDSRSLLAAGVKNRNLGQFLLGLSMVRPPMLLLVATVGFTMVISLLIATKIFIAWLIILLLFVLNFIFTIATQSKQQGMLGTIVHIPKLFLIQAKSLLKIKRAKKDFLKTQHQKIIYIDEVLSNEHK